MRRVLTWVLFPIELAALAGWMITEALYVWRESDGDGKGSSFR